MKLSHASSFELRHTISAILHKTTKDFPYEVISKITRFLTISDRFLRIDSCFETLLDVLLKECRDPTSRIAISYPSYYEKYAVNTFDNISQKLVAWQQLEHNDKQFVEYSIINRMFTTTIGIIDEDEDDEFFAKPMDVMIERYIYIQFDMNYENMVFIGKKRRLAFNKVLGGFQKYGFAIEQGFPYSHGMDTVYVSKTHLLGYTDLMDTNLFSKAKQYSKKACLSLLLEMHDQVFRALVS